MSVHPALEGLKVISVCKDEGREEFHFLEAMRINGLANELVGYFSNLTSNLA